MNDLTRTTITSMEAAEWCGKDHAKLLRDIRNYISQLGEAKIGFTDFFKESNYVTDQNKTLPCFLVTKKGCEFIAHKMTGQKGTEFTARYINRFHEMESGKLPCPLNPQIASSVAELGRVTERIMRKQGSPAYKIAEAFKLECEQFGIQLPADFVKVPEYTQMALSEFLR
ncbi:Rha family transcriptional regulator [Enterocloster lavalensis]|mgnify:FL=1|uniref:Phage regulatory protein, rha family n=1 Tax=Enterocloster lavalensis TaxID=460384 RepID=A0A1I0JMK5_9FIRM|nr:Rha family transcriptional regulator [Enterocloster lavalensis]SEU11671.1 phage regulatory protein, rha family [Enterocloster lavalensis]